MSLIAKVREWTTGRATKRNVLNLGDKVTHDAFGLGTVVAVRGDAEKAQAQIDFGGDVGPKWLLLRYAPLEKL